MTRSDDDVSSGTLVAGEVGWWFETTLPAVATQQLLETVVEFDPEDEPSHVRVEG